MSTASVSKTKTVTAVEIESATIALDGTNLTELIASLNETKDALKVLEATEKEIRASIFELLGDAEEATIDGVVQIRSVEQSRSSIDKDALAKMFPEAVELCTKTTTYKVLRTK